MFFTVFPYSDLVLHFTALASDSNIVYMYTVAVILHGAKPTHIVSESHVVGNLIKLPFSWMWLSRG